MEPRQYRNLWLTNYDEPSKDPAHAPWDRMLQACDYRKLKHVAAVLREGA